MSTFISCLTCCMPSFPLAFPWCKKASFIPVLCLPVLHLPSYPLLFDIWSIALFAASSIVFPSQNPPWSCCYSFHSTEESFSNHWINSSKWELRSISCLCDWRGENGATVRGWAGVGSNRHFQRFPLILFFWGINAVLYLESKHIWENVALNWVFFSTKLHLALPQYLFVQTALSSRLSETSSCAFSHEFNFSGNQTCA